MENNGLNNLSKEEDIWVEAMSSYLKRGSFSNHISPESIARDACILASEILQKFNLEFKRNS